MCDIHGESVQKHLIKESEHPLCPVLKAGFHMSGKSQMIGDFTVSQQSQILRTNENMKW